LNLLLSSVALNLKMLAACWEDATHLGRLLLSEGAVHVVARLWHLRVRGLSCTMLL